MMLLLLSFIATSLIFLWVYIRIKTHKMVEMSKHLPGPKTLPLLGNVLDFGANTQEMFLNTVRLAKDYRPLYRFWIGPQLFVVVTEPEHVEAALSSAKILDKGWTYITLHPWLGTGLLTSTGQKWKTRRRLITPAFHFKILEQFIDVFNSNVDIFVKKLVPHANDGEEFNIYPYVTMYALDNICETAMGQKVNAQIDNNSEYVIALRRPWLYSDLLFSFTPLARVQNKCLDVLHNTTRRVLQVRKQALLEESKNGVQLNLDNEDIGIKKKLAFLDLLILSSQNGTVLSDEDIREEVDTIMFEGHDTASSTISFTSWVLAQHQDVQDKVVEELKGIFGDSNRPPNYQDLQEMKYLEMVIKETLRLYPSVPYYGRQLTEDLQIDGYNLPAGANVFILSFETHRNEKYFPDPEKFDPDRFLPENSLNRHPFCYVPFAAGPRNCVGQRFAMIEMKTTFCHLLRQYKFLPGTVPLSLTNEAILKSTTGINIRVQKR